MKNDDDGPADFELVWHSSDSHFGNVPRLVGVNVHPPVWHKLTRLATIGGLHASGWASETATPAEIAALSDAQAEAATQPETPAE